MQANQANIEYFFRLIYSLFSGSTIGYAGIETLAAHIWLLIIWIGYILSACGLALTVYLMVRLFQLREEEEKFYGALILAPEDSARENLRWEHIRELASGSSSSEWREAIIEADIMLHDVLTQQGFQGEGVAEKLRAVDQTDLGTLQDAWEAHKVRNQIAHEGSAFPVSASLAQRTIQRYEAVLREFGVI